ncbi:hypothetical protein [Pseudomonas peradeniyensis]|nr:hypothetical protein [Pseudomonas peradeniyensis]
MRRRPRLLAEPVAQGIGAGGDKRYAEAWQPHVLVDHELITG